MAEPDDKTPKGLARYDASDDHEPPPGSTPSGPLERPRTIRPEVIEQFVENQGREIELRKGELEQKLKADEYTHTYALEALKAQSLDRQQQRAHQSEQTKGQRGMILFVILTVVGFASYCVHANKPELATEIVKLLSTLAAGAIGGYGYGKTKRDEKTKDE